MGEIIKEILKMNKVNFWTDFEQIICTLFWYVYLSKNSMGLWYNYRWIGRWKRIENIEIDPRIFKEFIYKGNISFQWENNGLVL